jgi:hypothetical protein
MMMKEPLVGKESTYTSGRDEKRIKVENNKWMHRTTETSELISLPSADIGTTR